MHAPLPDLLSVQRQRSLTLWIFSKLLWREVDRFRNWKSPWASASLSSSSPQDVHSSQEVCYCALLLGCVQLFVTWRTVARQAPLSMGFSRQKHWGELPCPPPRDPLNSGIGPAFLASPAFVDRFFSIETPGKPHYRRCPSPSATQPKV